MVQRQAVTKKKALAYKNADRAGCRKFSFSCCHASSMPEINPERRPEASLPASPWPPYSWLITVWSKYAAEGYRRRMFCTSLCRSHCRQRVSQSSPSGYG